MPKERLSMDPPESVRRTRLRKSSIGIGLLVVLAALVRLSAAVALAPIFADPPELKVQVPAHLLLAVEEAMGMGTEGFIFTICLSVAVMEIVNLVHGIILLLSAQQEVPSVKFLSYWCVSYTTYHGSVALLVLMYVVLLLGNGKLHEGFMLLAFETSRVVLGLFFIYATRDVRIAVETLNSSAAPCAPTPRPVSSPAPIASTPCDPAGPIASLPTITLVSAADGAGDPPLVEGPQDTMLHACSSWRNTEPQDHACLLSKTSSDSEESD